MRNLRIVRKFTSASPLPLPSSSIFCAGENGCLFGCVRIENELVADDASLNSSEAETNLPPPHQFLSNLIRISEFNHIEELTNSNLLQDTFAMQYVPSTECLFLANTNGTLLQYQLNGEACYFTIVTIILLARTRWLTILVTYLGGRGSHN